MVARSAPRPLRALVVEDEQLLVAMLETVLSRLGVVVERSAATRSDAMALLVDEAAFDMAFVDINLDVVGGGIDVAKEAAARGMYVVIVTGNDRVPDDLAGQALLLKPFSADHLEAIVADARRTLSVSHAVRE